jgi:membrane-associated phospholipid phosphatase
MKTHRLIIALLMLTPQFAAAQNNGPAQSVYRIEPWVDYPVLVVGALGASVPFFMEDQILEDTRTLRRSDVNRFDRHVIDNHSKLASFGSHLVVIGALSGPIVYDYLDVGWNGIFAEDMVVYMQALAFNSAIANGARYGFRRARPDAYRQPQPVSDPQEFASFYSGHTASVVAALSAFSMTHNYRYGPHAWPWVVTALAGVSDGMLRVFAGRHFYTDSITGVAAGAVIGVTLPILHRRAEHSAVNVMPIIGEREVQLVWSKKFY